MKNSLKTTLIAACMICAGLGVNAQTAPVAGAIHPAPPAAEGPGIMLPPPQRPGRPGPPDGGPQARRGLQQLLTLNGKVIAYIANDRYEYDAFSIQSSGNAVTVRFPARLGAKLMKAAPKGETVSLNGFYDSTPQGTSEFHFVNAKIGNEVITDTPPAITSAFPTEVQKAFNGAISSLRRNQEGMVNGIVLSDKQIVELPPPAAEQLQALLKAGDTISGNGIKVTPPDGVVIAQNIEAIRLQTLTLNGQTYLVR